MADFFQVTEEQVSLFEPLMPDIYKVLLKSDPGLIMVGAAEGEMACGVLVCRDYDNTISILYMAVSEEYRGHGLATGMVEFLCSAALRAEHAVYCDFVAASPYEDPVYGVLNATGMFSLDRLPGGRYEGYISELANAVRLSDNIVMNTDFLSFDQAKTNERNQLRLILRENDCDYIEEDRGQYLYDLSYIAFSKARHQPIAAIMVAKGPEEGVLEIPFVWSYGRNPKEFFVLINHVAKTLIERANAGALSGAEGKKADEVTLRISAINESSEALLKKLLPDFRPVSYYYRAIYDMK